MLLSLLYAVWLDSRQATVIVGSVVGSALLAATLTACWHLNYRDDSITPSGLYATATHHDVRLLAKDVATINAQRFGDPASMPVLVELNSEMQPDPVLGWYLHESQVRWVRCDHWRRHSTHARSLHTGQQLAECNRQHLYGEQLSSLFPLAAHRFECG